MSMIHRWTSLNTGRKSAGQDDQTSDEKRLIHGESILAAAFKVHKNLGPGLLESAYEVCLFHELNKAGLPVERQVELPLLYDGIRLDAGFRMDLVIDGKVIVEVKSIERLAPIHEAQLMTYLRISQMRVGLLLNFNCLRLKDGILRRAL